MFKASMLCFAFAVFSAFTLGSKRSETGAWALLVSVPIVAALALLVVSFVSLLWEVMP